MSITIPGYIQVNDAAGNTVAFLSPEADKIKDCWISRRLNEESTLNFYIPSISTKLSELNPESRIVVDGREFIILRPNAMDTERDDKGQVWTKVMAEESWKLLGKIYPTINNDPNYPWPENRKGDAYNDPDYGWIVPDALVVCIVSNGDDLSGGLYTPGTAAHALYALLKNTEWTLGTVDVSGTRDLETEKESLLANIQEVQKIWGGNLVWEYVFDEDGEITERKLHLRDEATWRPYNGFQVRYAKNLKHIVRTDNDDIVTRLYPFGEDDLDIYSINNGVKYVENFSYTNKVYTGVWSNPKIFDPAELKAEAEKHLAKICKPRYTYRIKVVDLRTLPEYSHEHFELGDLVRVIDEELNIDALVRIVHHKYNVFMPWQCELEVGEPEERLISKLKDSSDITKYINQTVKPNKGIAQLVKGILDTFHTVIQGAQGDFDVVDGVATWYETENGERTGRLVRITPGGVLISDDGGQTSQLAITGEGIAADAIVGTLGMFAKVKADQVIIGSQGEGISEELIAIGPDTTFAEGYDPRDNHVYFQYSADGATGWHDTFNPATDKYMRQKVGDDGTWSDPMRVVGEDGQDGDPGADGTSAYLWVRYSQNADGNPMTTDPTGAKYIGIATTTTASAPTDYTDYSWSLIKGTDGIPGEPGADGQTSYLHIKYSDDGVNFTANNGEDVGAWIGTYVDFVQEDSTTFSDYTWNKVKGEDGQDVRKFTSQPVPPYDVGDLWIGGSDGKNTLICVTARESGDFVASDWKPMTAPDVLKVDNRCKALFHFDGSINDHRGIMPTFSRNSKAYLSDGTEVDAGVPRFEAGQFGQAVLIEEGCTNIITSWPAGWYTGGGGIVAEDRGVQVGAAGNTIRLTNSGTVESYYYSPTFQLNPLTVYTVQYKYRGTVAPSNFDLHILSSTGTLVQISHRATSISGEWKTQQLTFTTTADITGANQYIRIDHNGNDAGYIEIAEIVLVQKSYPLSFPGYGVTRSPETLTIPTAGVLNPQGPWTIACWAKTNTTGVQWRYLIALMTSSANQDRYFEVCLSASDQPALVCYSGGSIQSVAGAPLSNPTEFHHWAATYDGNTVTVYVDGIPVLSGNYHLEGSFSDHIKIGYWHTGLYQWNGLIDDLAIFDYAATDEEIEAWYEADAPFYALDLPKPELPGYVKIESDGLRVYDNAGKLRGVFGSWLKELIRKYGIKIIDGEIYSTMFQTGEEGTSDYIKLSSGSEPLLVVNNNKHALSIWASNSGGFIQFFDPSADDMRGQILPHNDADGVGLRVQARSQSSLNYALSLWGQAGIEMHGKVWVNDDFKVFGVKDAVVPTENYGLIDLSVIEMPEVKFMDEGIGEIVNGVCRIDIDPIFLETIEPNTTETPFIVHLTPYDWLNLRVKEIGDTYFVVEEKDGICGKFSWQLTATRKGYAGRRLDRIDEEDVLTSNWEDDLNGFLEQEG